MTRTDTPFGLLIAVALTLAACGSEEANTVAAEEEARDLTLPPPPAISAIEDEPEPETERARPPQPQPVVAPAPVPEPEPEEPAPEPEPEPARLDVGTIISARASDTLTSRHNEPGDSIRATLDDAVSDVNGEILIPAGAVFTGVVTDIAPAERPGGEGRMVLMFDQVHFDGGVYTEEAGIDTVGVRIEEHTVPRRQRRQDPARSLSVLQRAH